MKTHTPSNLLLIIPLLEEIEVVILYNLFSDWFVKTHTPSNLLFIIPLLEEIEVVILLEVIKLEKNKSFVGIEKPCKPIFIFCSVKTELVRVFGQDQTGSLCLVYFE